MQRAVARRRLDRIAALRESVLYLHDDQFFPGWSVLVLRRHATELFDLEPEERRRLMDEVSDVARALKLAFDARKVNYALFGNLVPHVHWHVIPRLAQRPGPARRRCSRSPTSRCGSRRSSAPTGSPASAASLER